MGDRHKFSYDNGGEIAPGAGERAGGERDAGAAERPADSLAGASLSGERAAAGPAAEAARPAEQHKAGLRKKKADASGGGKPADRDISAKGGEPEKKKKSGKPIWIGILASLVILVLLVGGLGFAGALDISGLLAGIGVGRGRVNRYPVDSYEVLMVYLQHPSLKSGDTLELAGGYTVDVNKDFGGFARLPLVNFVGPGSVNFTGGIVFMAGNPGSADITAASFGADTLLYIEAPATDLTAGAINDANVNAKTLNGSSHIRDVALPFAGVRMSVPVTFRNETSSDLDNIEVAFDSAGFIFPEGETYILDSVPAGGEKTADIPVVAVEGGRLQILARAVDESGALIISGQSDFINVFGPGYYSGDIHTHTYLSRSLRNGTIPGNIQSGYGHGLSYIVSVENDMEAEQFTQSMVDKVTGDPGVFMQFTGYESGYDHRHMLIYDYEVDEEHPYPSSEYGVQDYTTGMIWSYQMAINAVVDRGGIAVLPHFFDYNNSVFVEESKNIVLSMRDAHIEVFTGQHKYNLNYGDVDIETKLALNAWIARNVYGNKVFATMSSNNVETEDVGIRYIKGFMPNLSEDNLYGFLRNGHFFSSNGPEMRFTLGGKNMGETLNWNYPEAERVAEEEQAEPELQAADTPDEAPAETPQPVTATAKIYASDLSPLTRVRLTRYAVEGVNESQNGVVVFEEDLVGMGIYSFQKNVEVELVEDEFYILEVNSERARYYDDFGFALSNPIWAFKTDRSNYATIRSISNTLGADVKTAANGTLYIQTNLGIVPGLMNVDSDGDGAVIECHRFESDKLADYVIVDVKTSAKTHTVEKIYLV
jgi:hypothetical protein